MKVYVGDTVTINNFTHTPFTVIRREMHQDGGPVFDLINITYDDCSPVPVITEIYGVRESAIWQSNDGKSGVISNDGSIH